MIRIKRLSENYNSTNNGKYYLYSGPWCMYVSDVKIGVNRPIEIFNNIGEVWDYVDGADSDILFSINMERDVMQHFGGVEYSKTNNPELYFDPKNPMGRVDD